MLSIEGTYHRKRIVLSLGCKWFYGKEDKAFDIQCNGDMIVKVGILDAILR